MIEFHQATSYIEALDWNVFDADGILVSMSSLEMKVMKIIKNFRNDFKKQRKESCKVTWLGEILFSLGNAQTGSYSFHSNSKTTWDDEQHFYLNDTHSKLIEDPFYYEFLTSVLAVLR